MPPPILSMFVFKGTTQCFLSYTPLHFRLRNDSGVKKGTQSRAGSNSGRGWDQAGTPAPSPVIESEKLGVTRSMFLALPAISIMSSF